MGIKRILTWRLPSPFGRDEERLRLVYTNARTQIDHQTLALEEFVALTATDAPLHEGLGAAAEDARVGALRRVYTHMQGCLIDGATLSEAMRTVPSLFSKLQADIVEMGERTGRLEGCLRNLLENALSRQREASVLGFVVAYLGLLVCVHAAVAAFWTTYLAPQLAAMLSEMGDKAVPMPLALQVAGGSAPGWWRWIAITPWAVVGAGVTLMAWIRFGGMRHPDGLWRGVAGRFALVLPFVGQIGRKRMLADCLSVQAQLLRAGMPLDETLLRMSDFDVDRGYCARFLALSERVRAGDSYSQALSHPRCGLSKGVGAAVSLGEESGLLPESLERIAQLYQIQADARAHLVSRMAPAAAILLIASATLMLTSGVFTALTYIADTLAQAV